MFNRLKISNFLLIEELELTFKSGLTVVTGETGSGKSIIIDALMILFGAKFTLDIIRTSQIQATFEADFIISKNHQVIAYLTENDLLDQDEPHNANFRRIIDQNGKNKCYINGHTITNTQARHLGELLLDIHTQHASITLLKAENQRNLLDEYAKITDQVKCIAQTYKKIREIEHTLKELSQKEQELKNKRHDLNEIVDELTNLNLQPGEWEELELSHKQLANIDIMLQELNWIDAILSSEDNSILNNLRKLDSKLAKLSEMLPSKTMTTILDSVNNELHELSHEINITIKNIEKDPNKLSKIESRMAQIFDLSRKYRIQPLEIPEYLIKSQRELELLGHNLNIKSLEEELNKLNHEYTKLATVITSNRTKSALDLSKKVTESLHKLAITGEFKIDLTKTSGLTNYGLENVEYQICFNKGLNLQPLSKAASGGELSRTALAIYLLMSIHSSPELIIFDEIDVGIGGKIAAIVGQMLRELGHAKQIICITHQPQSACYGDWHLVVNKTQTNNKVLTQVVNVTGKERVAEIARMLGGMNITETTIDHAKEMLTIA